MHKTDLGRRPAGESLPVNPFGKVEADLIVFSHLRWEFVTQRPQHIISRFAADRKVLFVEEPIFFAEEEQGTALLKQVYPNIWVLQPKIGWSSLVDDLTSLVRHTMIELGIENPILWFYSAAFHGITERIPHAMVVYDCMDELSAFKGASAELVAQERELLKKAALVFTGGKSLYESKSRFSDQVFCYPSSVDRAHFEKALDEKITIPPDIEAIPGPIIGYYGVIDERIDLPLLAELAASNPDCSFVMIGPVVKIEEGELPGSANLHYLGSKPYEELPAYLRAFHIAMMPFALNESTRFISPTKTLEYLAAQKPVVSTPIYDVVRDYQEVIPIASNAAGFSAAIQAFRSEIPENKALRLQKYRAILQAVSWDKTVAGMRSNIQDALRQMTSGRRSSGQEAKTVN